MTAGKVLEQVGGYWPRRLVRRDEVHKIVNGGEAVVDIAAPITDAMQDALRDIFHIAGIYVILKLFVFVRLIE
jgi:hypothetical protein